MNDMEQDSGRFKQPIMVAAAGFGAALIIIALPLVYLENIIGATGLSEFVPAAAPPLGNTAHGLIAVIACLVSASAVYLILNRKRSSEMGVALREKINAANPVQADKENLATAKKRRFNFPKFDPRSLTRFLKKPKNDARIMDLAHLPQLRKIDAENSAETGSEADASIRAPLFSETEEVPIESVTDDIETLEKAAPAMGISVDEQMAEETPTENMAPKEIAAEETADARIPTAEDETQVEKILNEEVLTAETLICETPADDLVDLTIAQLADRLEAGLKRLKQLEARNIAPQSDTTGSADDSPMTAARGRSSMAEHVASPVVEAPAMAQPFFSQSNEPQENMAAARHADMDAALKAALGTLDKMSAQR